MEKKESEFVAYSVLSENECGKGTYTLYVQSIRVEGRYMIMFMSDDREELKEVADRINEVRHSIYKNRRDKENIEAYVVWAKGEIIMLMSTIYTYQENKRGYWEYDVKIIEKMYEDAYEIIERKMKPIRVPELEEFEVAIDIFDKKYILKGDDGRIMISEDDDGDLYVSVMNTERIKKEEREDK